MATCRFCKKGDREDTHRLALIKYGVRHYGHPDCLLARFGAALWKMLHDWQLDNFPYFAAKRAGLEAGLEETCRSRKEKRT